MPRAAPLTAAVLAALAAALALPAAAQFKVVNPDGSVTYTDRPPLAAPNLRVIQLGRGGNAAEPETTLPAELRQTVQRHPVTLYATSECAPCDTGRQLLAARGVPYTERRILSEEDAQALERLFGSRTLPVLTIGAQALRGLTDTDWISYLEAAGYPRQSRLPRGWQPAPATPLVERAAAAPTPSAAPPRAAQAAAQAASAPEAPPTAGIRF